MPDFLQELSTEAVNVLFETQAKLLVDVSPVAEVRLENGTAFPIRMVCSTTPAGDLIWKCHLLVDEQGRPYVDEDQRLPVKTRGTQIVCSPETLPYNEEVLIGYFDSDGKGIWPVPFLPEFFSHHPLAMAFSPEEEMIEIIKIEELEPLRVISTPRISSFYRELTIDRTRALPLDNYQGKDPWSRDRQISIGGFGGDPFEDYDEDEDEDDDYEGAFFPGNSEKSPESRGPGRSELENPEELEELEELEPELEEGPFEDFEDGDFEDDFPEESETKGGDAESEISEETLEEIPGDLSDELPDLPKYVNIVTNLSTPEDKKLRGMVDWMEQSGVGSKEEAKKLAGSEDAKEKDTGSKWLLTAIHRLTLLANSSKRLGAALSLIQKHAEQPIVVIQPRDKWAQVLCSELSNRGFAAEVLHHTKTKSKAQIRKLNKGVLQILLATKPTPEVFVEGAAVICIASFANQTWLDWLNTSHIVYGISIEELGLEDFNYVQEHPAVITDVDTYTGPGLSLFKNSEIPNAPKVKKPKKPAKPKFVIKASKGRPAKADSYEKALENAKKKEGKGMTCEIKDPQGEVIYITNVGDVS
jgi:hypothetical protein